MLKKIQILASIFILPVILSIVIIWQIKLIQKSKTDYNLSGGKVENFGFTNKNVKGSYKSPTTETKVFFIKLSNNDTIYSFFFRREYKYNFLISNLKQNDYVKIYNKGFTKRQNTVDIIQLEKGQKVLIDKNISDRRHYVLVAFLTLILFLYFFLPYKFIWKKR
ncbi:MAG: hypothetical protein K0R36_2350 [Chryseobacterium sp.]|jgi:hypothetical protein|nr:hypothetical protein [Chryseobacterium sp.]